MLHYTFRESPARFKNARHADPQAIGEAITKIKAEHAGHLRPEYVWQSARRDPSHTLYQHFEWDTAKAAELHWNDTARRIIRIVCVRDDSIPEDITRYAFVSVRLDNQHVEYYSRNDIVGSEKLQHLILEQADKDLEAWQKRYAELTELCQRVQAIRAALQAQTRNGNGGFQPPKRRGKPAPTPVSARRDRVPLDKAGSARLGTT